MKLKKRIWRIAAGAGLFVLALTLPLPEWLRAGLYGLSWLICGLDVLAKSARNISRGQVFDENFLMSIATIGAFAIGEYPEGAAVMLFYQVGELFQAHAVNKSRKSIAALSEIRADYANLLTDGHPTKVHPEEVQPGSLILIKPGERVPLDGVVTEGASTLDTSALTGESLPRSVSTGDQTLSGAVNLTGTLTVRVTASYAQSTVSKILDLVENASDKKAVTEQFISRFARYYTPCVVAAAVLMALLPPLLIPGHTFDSWIYRSLVFLVISCPCALVISVPLGFFGGIGGAAGHGILIKGGNYLEALSRAGGVAFDKTGTLTRGSFAVSHLGANEIPSNELLEWAAYAEADSNHPIGSALKAAYGQPLYRQRLQETQELAGLGIRAVVDGKTVLAGNAGLLERFGVVFTEQRTAGTIVYVAVNGVYAGFILIEDQLKPQAAQAVAELQNLGVEDITLLSGDNPAAAYAVARELGISSVRAGLLPQQKVEELEKLLQTQPQGRTLLFVGDGINDAPVLARADVGVAMGGVGSDAAVEAADVVLMDDNPLKVPQAVRHARFTMKVIRQNIALALGVKALILLLGALGEATMWEAVFADVGVSVAAILNAVRPLRFNPAEEKK